MSVPDAPVAALEEVLEHPAGSGSLSSRGEVADAMAVLFRGPLSAQDAHGTGHRPVMAAGTAPGERAEA